MSWDWANAWRIHVNFLFFEREVTILDNFGRPVRIVLNITFLALCPPPLSSQLSYLCHRFM